jgi:hypothetical protein
MGGIEFYCDFYVPYVPIVVKKNLNYETQKPQAASHKPQAASLIPALSPMPFALRPWPAVRLDEHQWQSS